MNKTQYERELDNIGDSQQKALVMELMTSWERNGRQEGLEKGWQEGQLALVKRLLQRRLGVLSPAAVKQVSALSTEQLEQLAEALLDFSRVADLQRWLAHRKGAGSA